MTIFVGLSPLSAQELLKGMTMSDVLSSKDWGVPERKMHYETSRKERWYYDGERYVDFHSGTVSTWKSGQTLSLPEEGGEISLPKPKSMTPPVNNTGTSVNAFLREVEKENGEDTASDPRARKPKRRR